MEVHFDFIRAGPLTIENSGHAQNGVREKTPECLLSTPAILRLRGERKR